MNAIPIALKFLYQSRSEHCEPVLTMIRMERMHGILEALVGISPRSIG